MCIIVIVPPTKDPTEKTLRTCFTANPDGAGLMYIQDKKVIIVKGLMTFHSFYEAYEAVPKSKLRVLHFRIATSGGVQERITHPFPVTTNTRSLYALNTTADVAVVHNGFIAEYHVEAHQKMTSDTALFTSRVLTVSPLVWENANLRQFLPEKLVILDATKNKYYTTGEFSKDKDGVQYSNTSYKERVFSYCKICGCILLGIEKDYCYKCIPSIINPYSYSYSQDYCDNCGEPYDHNQDYGLCPICREEEEV